MHGKLNRDLDSHSSATHRNAYDAFCESNYRRTLRKAAYYGDYNEASSRSHSYCKKMRHMKERSLRHGDNEDLDKLYSSDISTVKKMLMAESNKGKLKHHKVDTGSPNKDENFANRDTKRKNKKKPTASE